MKQKFYLIVMVLFLLTGQSAKAQIIDTNPNSSNYGKVVWLGTDLATAVQKCAAGEYVYLYNVSADKFLNAGGGYGVHAVMSSVGMRVKIRQTTVGGRTVYTVQGRVDNPNQGSYMSPNGTGNDIYMDRDGTSQTGVTYSQPNWRFAETQGSVTLNSQNYTTYTYAVTNNDRNSTNNLGLSGNNVMFVGNNGSGRQWRIITEKDYDQAMDNVTWGEVDLGAFVQDAEFGRDNMDGRYWVWSTNGAGGAPETGTDAEGETYTKDGYVLTGSNIHWHQRNQDVMCNGRTLAGITITPSIIGSNVMSSGSTDHDGYRNSYAQYYAAEIYNEVNSLMQEIHMTNVENLTSGLYKLTAQALYYDDADGLTNDGVSYFVVKVQTGDDLTIEKLPIIPMNKVSGNNITPHSGVSAGKVFDTNAKAYVLNFFVELTQESKLTIGIETTKAEGWTVIGNVHLYAHGKQVVFCNEEWTNRETLQYSEYGNTITEEGDPYEIIGFYNNDYSYPISVNYLRTFTLNKWNTICLPIPVAGAQIRQAFGNDCILSELDGIYGSVMKFKSVDLDTEGLEAGKPYIIKLTREPDVKKGESLEQTISNGGQNHTITVKGPTYFIPGVMNDSYQTDAQGNPRLPDLIKLTGTGSPTVTFEGTFYKKVIKKDSNESTSFDNWVISKGNMYHLQNTKDVTVYATYCYLHAPKEAAGNAKSMRIMVDDEEVMTTAIEGLFIDNGPAIEDNEVYTLNGQRVGGKEALNALPKGVYIVNGRKYVVR